MIKNASIFRIALYGKLTDEILAAHAFAPCGATQQQSTGWAPPRGEAHGAMVESIAGHLILRFVRETKTVPGQAIARELEARIAKIEREEGRKPGRKESRELKEEIVQSLLPHAFPKRTEVPVWIDPARGLLVIGSTSTTVMDLVISALVRTMEGLTVDFISTQVSPQAAMTQWLTGSDEDWPASFAAGRDVELHSDDEMKTVVKYNRHHLDDAEMKRHITQGKLPVSLALDWNGRVQFTLTKAFHIKKIKFLDTAFEGQKAEDAGGFDADWAIATGELGSMIDGLIEALGGEIGQEAVQDIITRVVDALGGELAKAGGAA